MSKGTNKGKSHWYSILELHVHSLYTSRMKYSPTVMLLGLDQLMFTVTIALCHNKFPEGSSSRSITSRVKATAQWKAHYVIAVKKCISAWLTLTTCHRIFTLPLLSDPPSPWARIRANCPDVSLFINMVARKCLVCTSTFTWDPFH